ncbi:hypothetical protein [Hafnia paralvei]|uniref:hypothetical protein n=1 Tax=Hafnia paralvei TaxID=546367 RepID=UPI00107890F6|nr:hypothetical protein [Hafnia paralvei]
MISLNNVILFILFAFSGVYYKDILVKPSYISVIISCFIVFVLALKKLSIKAPKTLFTLLLLLVVYTIIVQLYFSGEVAITVFFISIILIPFISSALKNSNNKRRIVFLSYLCLVIYYSIEAYLRIKYPDYSHLPKEGGSDAITSIFYIYKINSIAFEDSNFVSVILVIYYIGLRISHVYTSLNIKWVRLLEIYLLFLIVMTFSRSAYVGVFLFEILRIIFFRKKNAVFIKLMSVVLAVFVTPLLIYTFILLSENDVSFLSKFHIIDLAYSYIINADASDILFGIGFGNSVNVLGMGAHNIIVALLIENGLFGVSLYLLVLTYIAIRYRLTILLIVPITVMGLSFSQIAMPYFYVFIAWIIYIDDERKLTSC